MAFSKHNVNGLIYDTADGLSAAGGVRHAFTTRLGGVSSAPCDSLNFFENHGDPLENILENYRLLGEAVGLDMTRAVGNRQVHGDAVKRIVAADAGRIRYRERPYDADGLVTDVPNLPLVAFSADCCTLLLYDPIQRCIGAVPAGWKGPALGVVRRAVETMADAFGSAPADVRAALGPAIGPCCFETDRDVPDAILAGFGAEAERFIERRGEKFHVDLRGVNRAWLLRAGLLPEHVEAHEDCTACRLDRYWSHRKLGARRGGQIAVIALEETP